MKNITYQSKIINHFSSKKNQGFTLIELLIVVIILGVLSAVAVPNLLGQIGKAIETEAKTSLGVLARSQQVYHFENKTFYSGNDLSVIGIGTGVKYYAFTTDNTADRSKAIHTAYATDPTNSAARDFSIGVYYNAPEYSQTFCIATGIDSDGTTSSVTAQADGTCNGGTKIE